MEPINFRFIELRKACGKNQSDFAKVLGISRSGVSAIESGRRRVTDKHLVLLSNWSAIPVNVNWLRTGEGDMFLNPPADHSLDSLISDISHLYCLDSFDKSLVVEYLKLSAESRFAIKHFIRNVFECL